MRWQETLNRLQSKCPFQTKEMKMYSYGPKKKKKKKKGK